MTSPVLVPKEPRRRRSSLKRQRLTVLIALGVVVLLAVAFAIIYTLTSRIVFPDADGTKYYIVKEDGIYVMQDADGNRLPMNEDESYYITSLGTILTVDEDTGEYVVVAAVLPVEGEALEFQSYDGTFDILLYPMLERAQIASIRIVNETGDFTLRYNEEKDDFEISGFEDYTYDDIMFSSLVVATGYTSTHMRLELSKVKEYGYAEYGLPDDPNDAKQYFEITTREGKTHKVILGNLVPSGSGYYARHADREEVYILKETETTTYSKAFSEVMFSNVESFVEPLLTVPMSSTNYYDVTDFQIHTVDKITDEMLNDPDFDASTLLENVISFDFTPIEVRKGTLDTSTPYEGTGRYAGFPINSLRVDDCLNNLMNMEAKKVVRIFTEEEQKSGRFLFFQYCRDKGYDVAYSLQFISNLSREGADKDYEPKEYAAQEIWISSITADGTYYAFNPAFGMIVEVGRQHMEYLEWNPFSWIESNTMRSGIAYLQEMICTVPGYAQIAGLTGSEIRFTFDNSESIKAAGENMAAIPPTNLLNVWANGNKVDAMQVKLFYESLLRSSLSGMASCSEEQQAAFREAAVSEGYTKGNVKPLFVIKMVYNTLSDGSGETETRTYCFYEYGGGSQCFMTYNGLGSFYMLQDRVEKVMSDLGRVFTGETITPSGKT